MRKEILFLSGICLFSYLLAGSQHPYLASPNIKQQIKDAQSDSAVIAGYIHLSNSYLEENFMDSCLWAAQEAKRQAQEKGYALLQGWADFLIGAYYYYEGLYDQGIEIEQAVVSAAEKMNAPLLRANGLKMIGWMYTEMGKEQEALALFRESLPVLKKYRYEDLQMNVGIGYYGMATAYFYLQNYDLALRYYDSALNASPSMDTREKSLALADRAAVLRDSQNKPEEALEDVLQGHYLIRDLPYQRDAKAYVQAEMALTYAKLNQPALANQWAQSALELYYQIPFIKRYVSVYKTISQAFYLAKNYKQAFETERETRVLADSIYEWRKLQVIEDLRTRYETDQKNAAIAQLKLESLKQKNVIIKNQTALAILGAGTGLLVLLGLLYYQKREKYHRRIRELETQQKVREEKERIARELHDNIGSQLATLGLGLNRLQRQHDATFINSLQDNVNLVMNELRETIWAIEHDRIPLDEFRDKITNALWRLGQAETKIQFSLEAEDLSQQRSITPALALALFRIFQEAVHNAIKHGDASVVQVVVNLKNDQLFLTIRDDGKGFDPNQTPAGHHYGLQNMKKRAKEIHAEVRVQSAVGNGTTIILVAPL